MQGSLGEPANGVTRVAEHDPPGAVAVDEVVEDPAAGVRIIIGQRRAVLLAQQATADFRFQCGYGCAIGTAVGDGASEFGDFAKMLALLTKTRQIAEAVRV